MALINAELGKMTFFSQSLLGYHWRMATKILIESHAHHKLMSLWWKMYYYSDSFLIFTKKMNIYEIIAFFGINEPKAKALLTIVTKRRKTQYTAVMVQKLGFYCWSWPSFAMAIFSYFTKAKYTFNVRLLWLWFSGGNQKKKYFTHLYAVPYASTEKKNRERETFLLSFLSAFFTLTDFYCIGTILGMLSWLEYWQ